MKHKLLVTLVIFSSSLHFSQDISKIEFHNSNAIILFKSIDVIFEPIKNNKKGKVRIKVKKDNEEEYFSTISKEEFAHIYNACTKIKFDTVALKNNIIDGSSTVISLHSNLGTKKNYYATGLTKKSENDDNQKDFLYATKLIIKVAKLAMEDLIGYR